MTIALDDVQRFLSVVHPYDTLSQDDLATLAAAFRPQAMQAGQPVYALGQPLLGLYLIHDGQVAVRDENDVQISDLGPRNSFGERGLARDGVAVTSAATVTDTLLLVLPRADFLRLVETQPTVARFFNRAPVPRAKRNDLATSRVEDLMTKDPLSCGPEATIQEAAIAMAARHVSSICITEGGDLQGILTIRDVSSKVVAQALPIATPVADLMTQNPLSLPPSAIGTDVLHMMMERRIGHVPVCEGRTLLGIVTQTDLTRFQALSSAEIVRDVAHAPTIADMAKATARIPQLLVQLVAAGNRHEVTTRLITDVADTVTRRLLAMAEANLGAPPVPYLWLACGSQGRQEQTGVSDQDNCLILDDAAQDADMEYFSKLSTFVCDGLDACGYVYCPGDMMATNPRWCQPLAVWRKYFDKWIKSPGPEAQMLASVMFDLRPIGGAQSLFDDLQNSTLERASKNSIFVAHMASNALKHTPPLGLLRGFATIRSGEHKNQIDLKHNGVVPVVDLGRIYALQSRLSAVNTRARIEAAIQTKSLSTTGGQDLLDAYDLIAETRLIHQARHIKAGQRADNFLAPTELSDFERSHLRNAFVVVKSLQSALGHGRAALG